MNARKLALKALDRIAEYSGLRVIRDPIRYPVDDRNVSILQIPGYRQTDSYSCGAVVALMMVHTWHPDVSTRYVYELCRPDSEIGTPAARLVRALRKCGVGVGKRTDLKWRDIIQAIGQGFPIITTVMREDCLHLTVIYGVGRKPDRLYMIGNSLPVFGRKEYSRYEFEKAMWAPRGSGMICWGKDLPGGVPRSRPCKLL